MRNLKFYLSILLVILAQLVVAQVKEINPSVQWKFVKSQELQLKDGNWYNYEFQAEKGYDYLFTMTHNGVGAKSSIQVFNLQNEKIAEFKSDSTDITTNLLFDVKQSGMYQVFFGVNLPGIPDNTDIPVLFSLVRREKV